MADVKLTAIAVLAGVMTFTTAAYAGSILVVNNSFESPDVYDASPPFTTAISGVSGGVYAPTIPGWAMSTLNGNIGVYAPPGDVCIRRRLATRWDISGAGRRRSWT